MIGPYQLLEAVGKGGMGTVYRACNRETGAVVAVKVMRPELTADPVLLKRFTQECTAANRLRHPHLVRGLAFGADGGRPYLVMEFVAGPNLDTFIRDRGPLPEKEAVAVICAIAGALELAHEHQLVHRDVKPGNILLTGDGQAKLTDLGLLKDLGADGDLTRSRTSLGTAAFMAPEQFGNAKHVDARCDVYGLAATFYYVLTGCMPFAGHGPLTVLRAKLRNDFVSPRHVVPSLSDAVDQALCTALYADPAGRQRSIADFANQLTARPPGPTTSDLGERRQGTWAPERVSPAADRRVTRRYLCGLFAVCRSAPIADAGCPGEIQNVSLTGMGLQLPMTLAPGRAVSIEIAAEGNAPALRYEGQVCWVRPLSEGGCRIGCTFIRPLTLAELNTLCEAKGRTTVVIAP